MGLVMIAEIRRPFLFAVLVLVGLIVLLELVTGAVLRGLDPPDNLGTLLPAGEVGNAFAKLDNSQKAALSGRDLPPTLAIPYLALLDGIWLFRIALITTGISQPEKPQDKRQGCFTLLFAIFIITIGVGLLITAINRLQLMVAWLVATPFGTLTYLVTYGFFNRGGASLALSLLTTLKGGAAICLLLAQPQFLQNRSLPLLIFTSLFANTLTIFLHGSVPAFLISLTDAIAALSIAILALIWAIFLLVSGIATASKPLTLGQPGMGS